MTAKRAFLIVMALLTASNTSVWAQNSLGDLVAQGGYDWFLGTWAATTDNGEELVVEQKWALDRHAIVVDIQMGEFKMTGLMFFIPWREEVVQYGADNRGGTWKGLWRDEYGSAVQRLEHTQASGEVRKAEIVHTKIDNDSMKVAMYGLDDDGYRNSTPWSTLTYQRRKGASTGKAASASTSGMLGSLLSQNGYDWILGTWQGVDDQGRTAQAGYGLTLDGCAGMVNVSMGSFRYQGLVLFVPASEEVLQIGADNMGGYWKGTWTEDYEGLANRHEYTRADGTTEKMEHLYVKVNDGTFKVKQYAVEASGYRASTPRGEVTFTKSTDEAASK